MKQKAVELDELTQRRHELARLLHEDMHTPGGTLTPSARRWLGMERKHYSASPDNDLTTWAAARARIEAIEARVAADVAQRETAAAAQAAEAEKKAAEVEAKIRAKLAAEVDPVTVYKRAHAARTF
jgi:hypothetical protein